MKIIVDAFGGDNAPLEIIKGSLAANEEYGVDIALAGDREKIAACAKENGLDISRFEILDADGVIAMEDHPNAIVKEKKNCSMAVGMRALHDGKGDAFVTAGSTGAALMGGTFIVKRIKGIKRAAIATILPTDNGSGCMVLDVGANADCRPEMLVQFAVMGDEYMRSQMKVAAPRVGLLNIGTEDTKGGELQQQTFALLKESPLNFVGNVEARDVLTGVCDVLVCDGFSGNVLLKTCEGTVSVMMHNLKAIFKKSIFTKLAAAMIMGGLKEFKKKMDYTEVGGAPLLGVAGPVIKAHGNSKATAFKNAIRQAKDFAQSGVVENITASVAKESGKDD